jgi:hypothetical protein
MKKKEAGIISNNIRIPDRYGCPLFKKMPF